MSKIDTKDLIKCLLDNNKDEVFITEFIESNKNTYFHSFYNYEDILLAGSIPSKSFIGTLTDPKTSVKRECVTVPTDEFGFLHETAIIEFKGVLYASWYCSPKTELQGHTPICQKRSYDGGKTWSESEIIAEDKSGKILYCPPVYGICDDRLYMFINEMVSGDHMHALDLYMLNEQSGKFEFLWSRPIPFKLNTNVVTLPNGKLMLPGRIAEMDSFPSTPAVLISDSGKIDADWRLVKITENDRLPNGDRFIHPELTAICENNTLYMFSRNDNRRVPIVFVSNDFGENWSNVNSHDIPYNNSKIYAGTLNDGRHYMVCNIDLFVRERLALYITDDKTLKFTKKIILFDKDSKPLENEPYVVYSHYPSAYESGGKLYIIATTQYVYPDGERKRGAYLYTVNLDEI